MTNNTAPKEVAASSDDALLLQSQLRLNTARAKSLESWHRYILPYVVSGLAVLMLLVFGSVLFAGHNVLQEVSGHPDSKIEAALLKTLDEGAMDPAKVIVAVTAYQSMRHHDRASASLLTRELLRFSTFMIGAALTFVGALFVIGKFSDATPTEAQGSVGEITASLTTASPGIFAMVAGALLVVAAVYAHYDISVQDPSFTLPGQAAPIVDLADEIAELCALDPENAQCES